MGDNLDGLLAEHERVTVLIATSSEAIDQLKMRRRQLWASMRAAGMSRDAIADLAGVSGGRVSQEVARAAQESE